MASRKEQRARDRKLNARNKKVNADISKAAKDRAAKGHPNAGPKSQHPTVKSNSQKSAAKSAASRSRRLKQASQAASKNPPKTQTSSSGGGGKKPPTRTKTDYKGGGRSRKVLSRNVLEAKPNKPVGKSTPNKPQSTSYNTSSRYGKSKMPTQTGGATSYSGPKKPRTTAQGVNKRTVPTNVGKSEAKRIADNIKKGERNKSNIKIRKPKPAQIGQRTNAAGGSQPPPKPKAPGAAPNQGPKTAPGYNKNAGKAAANRANSNASARANSAAKILNRGAKPSVKGAATAVAKGAGKGLRKGGGAGVAIGALVGATQYAGQFNQGEGRSTGGRSGAAKRKQGPTKQQKIDGVNKVNLGIYEKGVVDDAMQAVQRPTPLKPKGSSSTPAKSKPKKTFNEDKWRKEYRAKQAKRKAHFYSKTKTGAAEAAAKANPSASTRKSADSVHRRHPQGNESRQHSWNSRPDVNKRLKRQTQGK